MLLDLVLVIIISRILTPDELGVFSLAVGSIAVGQMLREFGLSMYLIKEKELNDDKIQGCFTISIILCWCLGSIYFFSADAIGGFYNNENVASMVRILSINFFLLPFSTLIISLYNRKMQFGRNVIIMVSGNVMRVVSTLILLYFSPEISSIAWGSVIGITSNLIFAIYYGEWRYYKFNFKFVKEIISYTSFVGFSNIINQLGTILPEVIIGKFLNTEKVAYFSKGLATINLFKLLILQVIGSVVKPFIAKLNNQNVDMSSTIYTIYNYILVFVWPFCVALMLFAEDIIQLLYGPQWGEVVELTHIFAFFMLFEGLVLLSNQLLNILGDIKYNFTLSVIFTSLKVAVVLLFVNDGLATIVLAYSIVGLIRVAFLLPRIYHLFSLSLRPLLKVYLTNAAIAAILFMVGYFSRQQFQEQELFYRFAVNGVLLSSLWFALVFIVDHPLKSKFNQGLHFFYSKLIKK